MDHVPFGKMGEGVITYTAGSQQGAIKIFWLYFCTMNVVVIVNRHEQSYCSCCCLLALTSWLLVLC